MPAIRPTHIAQVAVPVRDLARAKGFYGGTLGLDHLFDAPPGLAFYRCGATRLMLSRPEGPASAGSSLLYYAVADAREAAAAFVAAGVAIAQPAQCIARVEGRDVWLAVARDSEGNLIGLMSEQPVG